jgi:probable lipoprotein (TIGR04455 family)
MSRGAYKRALFVTLAGWLAGGCSHLSAQYVMPGYAASNPSAIKHVTIAAWAPDDAPQLAVVMAQVAQDLIKLRKNYLVHGTGSWTLGAEPACAEGVDGVLLLRVMDAHAVAPKDMQLHGALSLLRCRDGAEVFRSEGQVTTATNDKSLADLTSTYRAQLGDGASLWAAPAFALVQALADPLPDPHLTDQDIEEKIELGCAPSARELVSG